MKSSLLVRFLFLKKFLTLFLVLVLVAEQQPTHAQVAPAVTRVAFAMGGIAERYMLRAGISSADARYAATIRAIGGAAQDAVFTAASTVGMVAAGVAGAPVWASVALGLGVGALAFGAYKLLTASGPDGVGVYLPASDPATKTDQPVSQESGKDKICLPGDTTCTPFTVQFPSDVPYRFLLPNGGGAVVAIRNYGDLNAALFRNQSYLCGNLPSCSLSIIRNSKAADSMTADYRLTYSGNNTLDRTAVATANPGYVPTPAAPETVRAPLGDAIKSLPSGALNQPVDNQTMADLTNAALQKAAAKAGYDGIPYSLSNPVTANDVATWAAANPAAVPTGADLVTPLPNGAVTMPAATGAGAVTDPVTTNPTTGTKVDLGTDPGIGSPTLDSTPTAAQIISPLTNLFPSVRSFVVPSVDAACPRWTFTVFKQEISMVDHCPLLEKIRPTLYAAMAAAYAGMALLIVLGA